jgi:gamma-glutamylputrescine oxidase
MAMGLAASWYEATVQRDAPLLLRQNVQADVCVIGGGLAGLTTALVLARAGKAVVLLEAARVACGASGRNGGFVSNGFALGIGEVAKQVGLEAAQELYRLSRAGTEFIRETIAVHDPAIEMGKGLRICVRYDDDGALLRYADELRGQYGEDVLKHSTDATRIVLDSQRYFSSLSFPRAFHIHPLRYALLLKRLAEEAGALICENSAAQKVKRHGAGFAIRTRSGSVTAEHVVHCVSSLDRSIHKPTGRAVLPVATYIGVTPPLHQDSIRTSEAIGDTRRAGDYYRLIDDDRILWGGRISTQWRTPRALAEQMRGDMASTFPRLAAARMEFAWGGLMGYALHKMPLIGRDQQGQWFATAFGGHGLNTTAMGGLLIGRAIADGDDSYRRFAPFAPRWAFGQLGRLGVQGTYWWMQARDRLDEARKTGIRR